MAVQAVPEPLLLEKFSPWHNSPATKAPLRIGFLLDGNNLPRFAARIIEDIQASNFAEISFLVYKKAPSTPAKTRPQSAIGRIARRILDPKLRKHALYELYLRADKRKKSFNHPLHVIDCSSLLSGIDRMEVEPVGAKFVHRFPPEAIEQIRSKNLDVLVRFGFNILKGDILKSARYGVWSYHHGDNDFYRGGPPHFWELYEHSPISAVMLQVLTEELDAGVVLCKSHFATHPTVSVSANRYGPYWGSTDLIIRKLNELHQFGWEHLLHKTVPNAPYQGKRKLYRSPSNIDMARWLAPIVLKKTCQKPFRRRKVQNWKIGIRQNHVPLFDTRSEENKKEIVEGFRWFKPSPGHFWADPFLLEQNGNKWVFFEDYIYAQKRAIIACAQISTDGNLLPSTPCLDIPLHHFSYPYVFRDGAELYMIPEASDAASVDLYRCERFPEKWNLQSTLLKGKFVDTSVWFHDGLWWMMTTRTDPDPRSSCLFLFYAKRLQGEWHFHPANPISTDVRNNRGAGRIFWDGARWVRPSQSCAPVYGYSFTLNKVTKLSAWEYAERPIKEFRPISFGVQATHTYNWIPGVEIIDGAKMTPIAKF